MSIVILCLLVLPIRIILSLVALIVWLVGKGLKQNKCVLYGYEIYLYNKCLASDETEIYIAVYVQR